MGLETPAGGIEENQFLPPSQATPPASPAASLLQLLWGSCPSGKMGEVGGVTLKGPTGSSVL